MLAFLLGLAVLLPAFGAPSLLVSGSAPAGATAAGGSFQPIFSADKGVVAFVSHAGNLETNHRAFRFLNVFVCDRTTGGMRLVSVSTNGVDGGDENSVGPCLSRDGRFVAFQSAASNLVPNDSNGCEDVFLHDRAVGSTVLVSRELSGRSPFHHASTGPVLSTNGRWLVFQSAATNLVADDTNGVTDLFLFDRVTGSNTLASVVDLSPGLRPGPSSLASLAMDGQRLAFIMTLSNSAGLPPTNHVLVRDLANGTTTWASLGAVVDLPDYRGATQPVLSGDGSAVFFHAYSDAATNLYRFTPGDGVTLRVCGFSSALDPPSPSLDGRFVGFSSNGVVHVVDALAGTGIVASVTLDGVPAVSAYRWLRPQLSGDGTRVCFLSNAAGLTPDPTNGQAQLYWRNLAEGVTRLVSADTNGAAAGELAGVQPAMSVDGNAVAFESAASTMAADDWNLASDVFVRDVLAGGLSLISRPNLSQPSLTPVASAMVFNHGITADGRFILYRSLDHGLFPGDTNAVSDLFLRDWMQGALTPLTMDSSGLFTNIVSVMEAALSAGGRHVTWAIQANSVLNQPSSYVPSALYWRSLESGETRLIHASTDTELSPGISANGRLVVFETKTRVDALEAQLMDRNGGSDVVLSDMVNGTTQVISRNRFGTSSGDGPSSKPILSADDRWLAFASSARDLTTNVLSGLHLFVRDLAAGVTRVVSAAPPVSVPAGYAGGAVFSRDGRFIAYSAGANHVLRYNLLNDTVSVGCSGCAKPALSASGRWLAAEDISSTAWQGTILLRDLATGHERRLNTFTTPDTPGGPLVYHPVLSGNARYVLFLARRSPLELGGNPRSPNLYLHDIARRMTLPLPVGMSGDTGNGASYLPQMAANDRTVVFVSFASDLVPGDYNDRSDVFVLTLAEPDTDGDGMDDDFELAYFNGLQRDGNGDLDGDGLSDRQEFIAGTDPTDQNSVLRVLTLNSASGGPTTIIWSAVPGGEYTVQFRDSLVADWIALPDTVTAMSMTASLTDTNTPRRDRRFYRVVKNQP